MDNLIRVKSYLNFQGVFTLKYHKNKYIKKFINLKLYQFPTNLVLCKILGFIIKIIKLIMNSVKKCINLLRYIFFYTHKTTKKTITIFYNR